MWKIVGFVSKATGLGSVVSLLIMLALSAGAMTGTYVLWKRSIIAANNILWEQKMLTEKLRVEDILLQEQAKSAERIAKMLRKQITLQEQIDADEQVIDAMPDRDAIGLDADSVSRINRIQ